MHTPCPTPVINNQDKSRTGVTRCTILVCILLLVTLRTPCTLYWASLIHRFDRFDRCWCAIPPLLCRVLLHPPLLSSSSSSSSSPSSSPSSSFACCPSAIGSPFSGQSKPTVRVVHLRTTNFQLFIPRELISTKGVGSWVCGCWTLILESSWRVHIYMFKIFPDGFDEYLSEKYRNDRNLKLSNQEQYRIKASSKGWIERNSFRVNNCRKSFWKYIFEEDEHNVKGEKEKY